MGPPGHPGARLARRRAFVDDRDQAAVAAGIGPAVLSSLAVTQELAAGTLRAIAVRPG
ncbi:MAG TPA: hypothetical protein VFE59_34925 [Trebonia sp.]|nr:hypothetical protein [Trebonia sp.]